MLKLGYGLPKGYLTGYIKFIIGVTYLDFLG
jgi:hypothetical protein